MTAPTKHRRIRDLLRRKVLVLRWGLLLLLLMIGPMLVHHFHEQRPDLPLDTIIAAVIVASTLGWAPLLVAAPYLTRALFVRAVIRVRCPTCGARAWPSLRTRSRSQMLCGGYTCRKCGSVANWKNKVKRTEVGRSLS